MDLVLLGDKEAVDAIRLEDVHIMLDMQVRRKIASLTAYLLTLVIYVAVTHSGAQTRYHRSTTSSYPSTILVLSIVLAH